MKEVLNKRCISSLDFFGLCQSVVKYLFSVYRIMHETLQGLAAIYYTNLVLREIIKLVLLKEIYPEPVPNDG